MGLGRARSALARQEPRVPEGAWRPGANRQLHERAEGETAEESRAPLAPLDQRPAFSSCTGPRDSCSWSWWGVRPGLMAETPPAGGEFFWGELSVKQGRKLLRTLHLLSRERRTGRKGGPDPQGEVEAGAGRGGGGGRDEAGCGLRVRELAVEMVRKGQTSGDSRLCSCCLRRSSCGL